MMKSLRRKKYDSPMFVSYSDTFRNIVKLRCVDCNKDGTEERLTKIGQKGYEGLWMAR